MENFLFQLLGLIQHDFNQRDGRRALIYLLGDGNNAIVAADILIFLIYQSYNILKDRKDLLEAFDGFIICPYTLIETETGCSNLRRHKASLNLLEDAGFIDYDTNTKGHFSRFKVNTDVIVEELDEGYSAIGKMRDDFWNEYRESTRGLWKKMNEYLVEDKSFSFPRPYNENIDFLREKGFKDFDILMMMYVQKYWKETYGTDYKWSWGEFNTLSDYLTSKGVKEITPENLERLRNAIQTLDEVSNLTYAYTARKIILRMNGIKDFKKRR